MGRLVTDTGTRRTIPETGIGWNPIARNAFHRSIATQFAMADGQRKRYPSDVIDE
jgi:hypothetical protein